MNLLKLENLSYSYNAQGNKVLDQMSYEFEAGKMYAIVGKSGAGKTTLLSLISGLASPTSGKILFNDEDISKMDKYKYRSQHVGVIFQSFNLLQNLTAAENVVLSMDIAEMKQSNKNEYAMALLDKVGLSTDESKRRVLKLSGGQQQRVAIARALSYNPSIILADEPTGNLDGETQEEIMSIFRDLAKEGKCIIIVTHSPAVADVVDEIWELQSISKTDPKDKQKELGCV
ncbi:ABC transporter ATP-binding protein [Parasporobacterium paucivorans]|uniref:Putative ABC transport system ATP-binding protein n=1 Tax=Parasporobacterium paucivorans DSM 15970 TaxID=1122934 RepID=A0A1M6LIS4_9FIRM|nr:ABC transporter ATP-binding protein [Parasporobacterium paucivorans]SHJ71045.1 putative ABC transport system ATP-binding protein [Parasporobacterium paucivorans DSM 15970]